MAGSESTIGALLDETGGSIKTGPFGTKLKASEYTATGVPVISVGEVGFGRLRVHHDTPRVDETVSSRMPEFLLKAGDIVFGRKGAVERSAQVQPDENGYFLGSDGIRIRLNVEECDPKFISYQLQTTAHRSWMIQHAAGTTMPSLNEGIIRRIPIVLKPLAEQKAIAAVLGALDDKIESNRRMNATLEAMARALFQSWFVDFDPVRAKLDGRPPAALDPTTAALFPDSFQDSALGPIPHGWEVKTLGEVIELAYGKPLKAEDRKNGPVCVYGANGPVGWHDEKLVSGPGIVVGRKGNPGVVTWAHGDFYPIDTTFYVEPRGECCSLYFLYYALSLHNLANLSADSAVPGLNRNHAYMSKQVIPSEPVLTAFDSQIAPIFASIHANTEQSRTLAILRDTLLPKLLSGELSVAGIESKLEAVT
jgi:type I restriction enzyme S subunit